MASTDFNGWKTALQGNANANANAFFCMYPLLDHFFMKGKGAPNPRDYYNPGRVDLRGIGDTAHFVKQQQLRKQ